MKNHLQSTYLQGRSLIYKNNVAKCYAQLELIASEDACVPMSDVGIAVCRTKGGRD
ncbi:MAG: hypothetical protein IKR17_12635 [Bacteroidales bacterium]|nr:hypothetical protein [Bacteroidales bacterium]